MKYQTWKDYPIGTKAHSISGGYWIRIERGWKWHTGDTFPTPGADVAWVELPLSASEQHKNEDNMSELREKVGK